MTGIWHPDAWIAPGPEWKAGYVGLSERYGGGSVFHSMEGPMTVGLAIVQGVTPRSWQFSVPKRGEAFYQHYPIYKVCWHGGGPGANGRFFGIEHEGVAGEPLTDHQIECDVAIIAWALDNDVVPWPGFIRDDTLWEHNQMTRFGSAPTACPSGRIPWQEVIEMAGLFQELRAKVRALETYRQITQYVLDKHDCGLRICSEYRIITQAVLDDQEGRLKALEPKEAKP